MAWAILYSIRDEKGQVSTSTIHIPSATSFVDAVAFAKGAALLLEPLVRGAIFRVGIAYTVDISALGLTASPLSNSDVEEGAKFQYKTTLGNYTSMRLPTFDEAKISAASRDVNTSDSDVAAFNTAMLSGLNTAAWGGGTTVSACDARGEDINSLSWAKEMFQSSRG